MKKIAIFAMVAIMTGCSSFTYKPTVNERADKNPANVTQDLAYCGPLAKKAAGYTGESIGDTLAGGAYGASMGAVLGATVTSPAGPAAIAGLGVGGVTGLFYGLYEADETYKRAYNSCMAQLGHPVLW